MITKDDCLAALVRLNDLGINVDKEIRLTAASKEIPFEILQFIYKHQGIYLSDFCERLRRKHNKNKSPLYLNIRNEITDEKTAVTTLAALLLQITLFGSRLSEEQREQFYKEARTNLILQVLNDYYTYNVSDKCIALLKIFKSDILVAETVSGRREFKAEDGAVDNKKI